MAESAADLELVLQYLNATLGIPEFPDYEGAANGLQVEGPRRIARIGAAVDASVPAISAAVDRKVDFLLVHHGLFWEGLRPLTGRRYRRILPLLTHGIALYSAHLPLDAHPELGNAAVLIRALGLEPEDRFGRFQDVLIGFETSWSGPRETFRRNVSEVVKGPVTLLPGGPENTRRIAVVTGGASGFIREAAESGIDTLLTGEGPHHTFSDAMELGVNVLYAGHYATETWGVRALAADLADRFGIGWEFLDVPSGL
jgi:dinuclear metal center YbgI/SA1388 family protein